MIRYHHGMHLRVRYRRRIRIAPVRELQWYHISLISRVLILLPVKKEDIVMRSIIALSLLLTFAGCQSA